MRTRKSEILKPKIPLRLGSMCTTLIQNIETEVLPQRIVPFFAL